MSFCVMIPARLQATRLPGKVLLDIAGKSMLQRVYEQALQSDATDVFIATDSQDIADAAKSFNAKVIMTDTQHTSGTDRIAQAVTKSNLADDTIVVNVQGDEPLINPALINLAADRLQQFTNAAVATLAEAFNEIKSYHDPNVVKVVMDKDQYALYFSRANIPYDRDKSAILTNCYKHIGLYAYRVNFIKQYTQLAKSPLEQIEALEQLRVLWHGYKIQVAVTEEASGFGVDTLEDLEQVRALLAKGLG